MSVHVKPSIPVFRFCLFLTFVISCSLPLTGCDVLRNQLRYDREGNKEFQNYRDAMASRLPEPEETQPAAGTIPDLQPYVATAESNMKTMPLVSISVNQTVSIRDVLFELARQADYDIELDPRITGSVIFSARERPFDQVIARLADIAGLRYTFDDDVLRVELDTPYNKTYKIDYLSYVRKSSSSVSSNISVVAGSGANTGSDYKASGESEADFWGELETNLKQILGGKENGALKTKHTPKVTAAPETVPVMAENTAAPPLAGPGGEAVPPVTGAGGEAVPPPVAGAGPEAAPPPAAPAVLRVESIPEEEGEGDEPGTEGEAQATFTINKQAGLVSVYASDKAQKEIEAYLKLLRQAVTAQVLIEAKVLQVQLSDEYAAGVDWGTIAPIFDGHVSVSLDGTHIPAFIEEPALASAGNFTIGITSDDFNAAIQAVSRYGTVKALASPRLTVLNNQPAALNVATNHVYFDVDIDVTEATVDTLGSTTVDSEAKSVPIGVLVNVLPSINLENNTISMAIRPTVTSLDDEIPDPAIDFVAATSGVDVVANVPQLQVQEIDSVIQVRSGQAIVMGGLLQDSARSEEQGVPILSETPMVGAFFKQHHDSIQKTELIIFLKATILKSPENSVDGTDKDLYRAFSSDRRPLRL